MRPLDGELLSLLADMPFLDRLEAVAVSGWSRGGVYGAGRRLEDAGLVSAVPHATDVTAPTRRFHLTSAGVELLADVEGRSLEALLRCRPVSNQWRRTLLERLDGVAVVYRLAAAVANIHHPIRFRWYRAMPMDAAISLPGGCTIAVIRQGPTADRTGFSKRLRRLMDGPRFGGVLLLAPDETGLRYARRLLAGARAAAVLALERDAAAGATGDRVWRLPSLNAAIDLRTAIDRMGRGGAFPAERPLARAYVPESLAQDVPSRPIPDYMLPALLKPAEKRVLDVLSDWPWIALEDLAGLLGLVRSRTYEIAAALQGFGLVTRVPAGGRRLTLTDQGLAMLARRDRTAVGLARRRWSAAPNNAGDWRSISGRRSRQLLRNMEHTAAVHGFVAYMARQARHLGWEVDQLDPPRKSSRYFRYFGGMRSIHPDAFGVLRRGDVTWPFFLEWERRAVRPVTMVGRLAPYLRYYSSHRPIDDHGAPPIVLVVFDDDIARTHFLSVAQEEMARLRVAVPLLASHRGLLEREGPLGRAWLVPGGHRPVSPVPSA
ncbi:MAG: replication-relaxation family protein [Chloroflexota bacterium]|nr:replication-relaxation family protein [Chloroflexota bacterium]MDE3267314.1 replication-relaxation family protein [Chloroflexota bacterium]